MKKTLKEALTGKKDAIDLLEADHKSVLKLFKEFKDLLEADAASAAKAPLVRRACVELLIHAKLEEEIFYPAVREVLEQEDKVLIDEARVEHNSAKDLIHQLLDAMPGEEMYDARFIVLSEQIKHHVKEEEGDIFRKAKKSGLDLDALGAQMQSLKLELLDQMGVPGDEFDEINLTRAHARSVLTQEGFQP